MVDEDSSVVPEDPPELRIRPVQRLDVHEDVATPDQIDAPALRQAEFGYQVVEESATSWPQARVQHRTEIVLDARILVVEGLQLRPAERSHRRRVRSDPATRVSQTTGTILFLKLILTPTLIAGATLLGRRFGPQFAGWLVGFPFTSAPVSVFLSVEQGAAFAASAALGSVASVIAQTAFALTYALSARAGWPAGLLSGSIAFAATGLLLRALDLPLVAVVPLSATLLLGALRLMPARTTAAARAVAPPRWDLPSRATVATILVVTLTSVAPLLGPFASGIVSGFPLYATVLAVFAHRSSGTQQAADVMRGLLTGLFGFAAFFAVVAIGLVPLGPILAFALATATIFVVQGLSLRTLRG